MGMPMFVPQPGPREERIVPEIPQKFAGFYGGLAGQPT